MIPAGDYRLYGGDDNLGQFRIIQAEQRFRSALRWLAGFESGPRPQGRMVPRSELYLAMASFRRGLDPLSLVGSIVSPLDQHDTLPWDIISERAYLRPFQGAGGGLP